MADQLQFPADLLDYLRQVSLRDDEILRELRDETAELPAGRVMQVSPEEGQFLGLLVSLTGARSVLEIGTFTGYSTLCLARALPAGGTVVTCDITDKWPDIGAAYWQRAGVADRIEVRIGDAADTLETLLTEDRDFDLVFLDADKASYPTYYELALRLVRPGGLIVADNTLFFGRVIDPEHQDPDTAGIRAFNTLVRDDERVDLSLIPFADGITLIRRRG